MNNLFKKIGFFALLTFATLSCTKPVLEPAIPLGLGPRTNNVVPCEEIRYMGFETATNWYGYLFIDNVSSLNTYKLKVWQLKTGQDNITAINVNAPIFVQNITFAELSFISGALYEILISPIDTHVVDANYTSTIIYIIESYDAKNNKICTGFGKANSYRYSRSNKQKG
jgi:hypothetical protein